MFERFTERARVVVVLAQEAINDLGHSQIDTEHLLVGLLAERDGLGAWTLNALGIDLDSAFAAVAQSAPPDEERAVGFKPFTASMKRAMERSTVEVGRRQLHYVGTEHLLLGLIDQLDAEPEDDIAREVLRVMGVSTDQIREKVSAFIPEGSGGLSWMVCRDAEGIKIRGVRRAEWNALLSLDPELELRRLLTRAAKVAFATGRSEVELGDLLRGYSELRDGAHVLGRLNIAVPVGSPLIERSARNWVQVDAGGQVLSAVVEAERVAKMNQSAGVTVRDLLIVLGREYVSLLEAQGWAAVRLRELDAPPRTRGAPSSEHRAGDPGPRLTGSFAETEAVATAKELAHAFGSAILEPTAWPGSGEPAYELIRFPDDVHYRVRSGEQAITGYLEDPAIRRSANEFLQGQWRQPVELVHMGGWLGWVGRPPSLQAFLYEDWLTVTLTGFDSEDDLIRAAQTVQRVPAH